MSLLTQELRQVLNARLADKQARAHDDGIEVKILVSVPETIAMFKRLGATDKEMAGLQRFAEKLAKKLIKKHKVTAEELASKGDE